MVENRDSKAGGTLDEIKGKANQAIGDVTDDEERRMEGKRQEKMGEAEKAGAEAQKMRKDRV